MIDAKVSVVIPVFNESQTIGDLVKKVQQRYHDFEIVVIDDGSADNTAEVAADAGARVFIHPYNIGNGAAIKSGIRAATGDIFVFMDGDGQHNPEDIEEMLAHLPEFDMVVGARGKGSQASVGRGIGNRIYNWLGSYVSKFPIEDLTSGFRAVKAEIARSFLYLLPNTYSYPTTITLGVLRSGRSLKYIPITTQPRRKGSAGFSAGEFCHVRTGYYPVCLFVYYGGSFYEYERFAICGFNHHFYDESHIRADMPDEI
jgi:glycosyltransferase involved in cell wall biosynthesis